MHGERTLNMPEQKREIAQYTALARARRQNRAQRSLRSASRRADKQTTLVGGTFFLAFVFIVFDIPKALFMLFLITYPLGALWALAGWATMITWLTLQGGYSFFTLKKEKNLFVALVSGMGGDAVGLPGLSGFLGRIIIKERWKQLTSSWLQNE